VRIYSDLFNSRLSFRLSVIIGCGFIGGSLFCDRGLVRRCTGVAGCAERPDEEREQERSGIPSHIERP